MMHVLALASSLGLVLRGDEHGFAMTSPDDRYRYLLGRRTSSLFNSEGPLWVFLMLNPSKARHDIDDPTVRKCTGFAKRGGARGFYIVNQYAYSATDPRDLELAAAGGIEAVVGEHNDAVLAWALLAVDRRIAAWGRVPKRLGKARAQVGHRAWDCFGLNQDGSPRHPLMLGYDTPIVPYAVETCP